MRVSERSVDHMGIGNPEDQLVPADLRQQTIFSPEAIVRDAFKFKDALQMVIIIRKPYEHAGEIRIVSGWDEPVRVVAPNGAKGRQRHCLTHIPPRLASSSRRTICIAGIPPRTM